jgi:hypothetical protein
VRRAKHLPVARETLRAIGDFGDAEIEDFHEVHGFVALDEEHVLRFEVPMDDPGVVRCAERTAYLNGDMNRPLLGHAPCDINCVDEVKPLEALHHEIGRAVIQLAEVADVYDVLITDSRRALGFAPEPRQHLRVSRVLSAKHLDGKRLVEARMRDPIDQAHPSLAEQGLDAVALIDRPTEQPLGRFRDSGMRPAHLRIVKPSRTI